MAPDAICSHQIRGRLRIRVDGRRGQAEYFARVKERMLACRGLTHVEVNPSTASILILHDVDVETIAGYAEQHALFVLTAASMDTVVIQQRAAEGLGDLDRFFKALSGGTVDLGSVLFLLLVGMGMAQVLEGQVMVPAVTLFWYALTSLQFSRIGA
jgi:hypothetical protein